MRAMFGDTLPPALSVLAILGFAALIWATYLVGNVVARKMSGWKAVSERFPMRDINPTGDSFKNGSGVIGNIGSGKRGSFDIRIAQEGVCIYPSFARRSPCLILWSAIRRVSVSDTSLLVTVDYERPFQFFLPARLLPTLQAKLSLELFHKAVSPFEAAKAALKDGAQPRWLTAIAGGAVKLAEKEYEREKKRREQ
jgi:hypothetical protein